MLIFQLGPDDFSKKTAIKFLATSHQAVVEFFELPEQRPNLGDFFGQDLFSKIKIVVLENLLSGYDYNKDLANKLAASKNVIVFIEAKVDKRVSSNKQWLAHKSAEVKQFLLPHGAELNEWVVKRAKALGGGIAKAAADLLAKKLGRDEAVETKFGGKVVDVKEIFDLWQADSELRKLLAYAAGREITSADVEALVVENGEVDVLKITNAIADGKKNEAFGLVGKFLGQGGDEKGLIIQLNALLSEQFRNIYALQDFLGRKISESEILEHTGWKSGRLFVLKKIASRFNPAKVKDLLVKLAALDEELKSSSTPPRVLVNLILSQLFV